MTEPRYCGQGNLLTKGSYRNYVIKKKKKALKKRMKQTSCRNDIQWRSNLGKVTCPLL